MKVVIKSEKRTGAQSIQPSRHTAALMAAAGKKGVNNSLEWDVMPCEPLTVKEIDALKRAHGCKGLPNLQRATEVKRLMAAGNKLVHIVAVIARAHRGERGYGERMISTDHATLSKVGEGVKK